MKNIYKATATYKAMNFNSVYDVTADRRGIK